MSSLTTFSSFYNFLFFEDSSFSIVSIVLSLSLSCLEPDFFERRVDAVEADRRLFLGVIISLVVRLTVSLVGRSAGSRHGEKID
jgi:hypothetical protein